MRATRLLLVLGLSACAGTDSSVPSRTTRNTPNVVVVLADDLGWGDLGCYNQSSQVPTVHLDALAAEGVRYTDAHSPSAVCTPTRYGLLTGQYCWRTRVKSGVLVGTSRALIPAERDTLASLFHRHGYTTGGVGKWHLGLGTEEPVDYAVRLVPGPSTAGFDHFIGIPASLDMPPYVWIDGDRVEDEPTADLPGAQHRRQGGEGFYRKGAAAPGFDVTAVLPRLAQEAVDFIEDAVDEREPFFLYLPLTAPHTPWVPTNEHLGRSGAGWYGDFVVQVDAVLGEVMAALERTGVKEDTLVVFTSDNGAHWPGADIEHWGHRANGPFRGQKADIHEGGHRVPFLVRWPGVVEAGTVAPDLLSLTDLYSTFAELLGHELTPAEAEDSFSHLARWQGSAGAVSPRTSMVQHSINGTFAMRSGRWKLIQGLGSGGFTAPRTREAGEGEPLGQLYDLERDPGETINLWSAEADVVERLAAELEAARTRRGTRPDLLLPAAAE